MIFLFSQVMGLGFWLGFGMSPPELDPMMELPQVTLTQAMRQAQSRAAQKALVAEALSSEAQAKTAWRRAFLPGVGARMGYRRSHKPFVLETPLGPIPQGSQGVSFFEGSVRQPLVDVANRRYKLPAMRLMTEAKKSDARRLKQVLAFEAALAFTYVLRLEAELKATRSFIDSLTKHASKVEAQVSHGRALKSDWLKIKLQRDDARLDEIRLRDLHQVATWNLGRTMGLESSVQPVLDLSKPSEWLTAPAQITKENTASRLDLLSMQQQATALGLVARAIRAERLPRLDGELRYFHLRDGPYTRNGFFEAELALSWKVFASGTRKTRAASVHAQRRGLDLRLKEQRRLAELETRQAAAQWHTAEEALQIRNQGVVQATETARVELIRYQRGLVTVNDWLDAEALLRARQTQREIAELDLVEIRLQYLLATGRLPTHSKSAQKP